MFNLTFKLVCKRHESEELNPLFVKESITAIESLGNKNTGSTGSTESSKNKKQETKPENSCEDECESEAENGKEECDVEEIHELNEDKEVGANKADVDWKVCVKELISYMQKKIFVIGVDEYGMSVLPTIKAADPGQQMLPIVWNYNENYGILYVFENHAFWFWQVDNVRLIEDENDVSILSKYINTN